MFAVLSNWNRSNVLVWCSLVRWFCLLSRLCSIVTRLETNLNLTRLILNYLLIFSCRSLRLVVHYMGTHVFIYLWLISFHVFMLVLFLSILHLTFVLMLFLCFLPLIFRKMHLWCIVKIFTSWRFSVCMNRDSICLICVRCLQTIFKIICNYSSEMSLLLMIKRARLI